MGKKIIVGILEHAFVRIVGIFFKSIVNDHVTECDKTVNVTESVSIYVANTISTNESFINKTENKKVTFEIMSILTINSDDNKVRYEMIYYVLRLFLLVTILLLLRVIICCHYAKHRSKQKILKKNINNIKMEKRN